MAKNKKLNISNLQQLDKRFEETKEIIVKGYSVKITTTWRPSKIKSLIIELIQKTEEAREMGLSLDPYAFSMLYIVKYFTDVNIPNTLASQVVAMNMLLDNELLLPIIEQFSETEVEKLITSIQSATVQMQAKLDEVNATIDLIKEAENLTADATPIDWDEAKDE